MKKIKLTFRVTSEVDVICEVKDYICESLKYAQENFPNGFDFCDSCEDYDIDKAYEWMQEKLKETNPTFQTIVIDEILDEDIH